MVRYPAAKIAALIAPHIPANGQLPIRRPAIAIRVEMSSAGIHRLSTDQISRGITWIRRHVPDFPLLSSPAGIWFSMSRPDLLAYRDRKARTGITVTENLLFGVVEPLMNQLQLSDPERERVRRTFRRAIEDLGDLVGQRLPGGGPQTGP